MLTPDNPNPGFIPLPVRDKGIFRARDGTGIYYEVSGEGRPLIFCYGLVCRREHWRHQMRYFGEHYQIITFDYRGHHASEMPANDRNLTLQWCAKDIQDLMNFLELKEAVVLGHSMGVPVAAEAGLLEPERIKALVLVCGMMTNPFKGMFYSDKMDSVYQVSAKLFDLAPSMMSMVWQRFTDFNKFSFFLTSRLGFNRYLAEEQDVLQYMEGVSQTSLRTFSALLRDYTQYDGREGLKGLVPPALVVSGTEDCITPMAYQEEMAKLIPKGILDRIPMGSHNAHSDLPDMVNQRIENFFHKIGYRP